MKTSTPSLLRRFGERGREEQLRQQDDAFRNHDNRSQAAVSDDGAPGSGSDDSLVGFGAVKISRIEPDLDQDFLI